MNAEPSVLLLIGWLGYGGAEKQACLLATSLPSRGIASRVAYFTSEPGRLDEMAAAGVPIHRLPIGGRGWWPFVVGPEILRLIQEHRIDVVQAFLPCFDILAPCLRIPRPGLRVVTSRRNVDDRLPARQLLLLRVTTHLAHTVVANSTTVAANVRERERIAASSLRVIRNGMSLPPPVDPAERRAARRSLGLADEDLVVLYLAHFRGGKGHRHLPAVIAACADRNPRARFVVVGNMESNSTYRRNAAAFQAALDAMGLRPVVHSSGIAADTRPLYAAADICLNLSDHEGMSNVIMEAMGAGLPVVATAAGAARELIEDGREGFVVPVGDVSQAAARLALLLDDDALRRRMGAAGRERMGRDFSVDRMVDAYAELYRGLAAGARS